MIYFTVDQFAGKEGTKVYRNYDYDGSAYVGTVKEVAQDKVIIQADDGEEFTFNNVSLQGKLRTKLKPTKKSQRWPEVWYGKNHRP